MSGRSPPLYCTLISITMHSHQSYPNITFSCVVGVLLGCISVVFTTTVLYGTVPRLILKKTNRLMQAVVFSQRCFLCGALLWNCSSAERGGLFTHVQRECSAKLFMRSILCHKGSCVTKNLTTISYRGANSVLLSTPLYYISSRFYAQNPVFEIAHLIIRRA